MEGWIKLYRSLLDWRWYSNPNILRVYLHLLLKANFVEKDFENSRILPGQVAVSPRKIGEDLNLTKDQVKYALKKLIQTDEITKEGKSKYTIVTIVNYRKYQESKNTIPNKYSTRTSQLPTTKECNNERSINNNEEIYDYNWLENSEDSQNNQ